MDFEQVQVPHVYTPHNSKKWCNLLLLSTIFLATYHCITGISAFENEFMSLFHMSHAEFALLSSIVFGCALFGALICPYIINRYFSLSQLMLASCILVVAGQILFVIACTAVFQSIILLYFARILVGLAYGLQNVLVFCSVYQLFSGSQWLPLAVYIISVTFDVGLIIGRYSLLPLYTAFNDSLSIGLSLGILLALLSVIACCFILRMENQRNVIHVELDRELSKVRHFSLHSWLLIIAMLIPTALFDITSTLMTEPLMSIFNITEYESDMVLSIIPLLDISLGFAIAWLASSFGYLSLYLVCSPILYCISFFILYLSTASVLPSIVIAIISMVIFAVATEAWFASSFACLFLSCRPEYISILNSVVSILNMSASMFGCFGFGLIQDSGASDRSPILMLVAMAFVLLVLAVGIFILDRVKDNGTGKQRENIYGRDIEVVDDILPIHETEPLLN